MKILSLLVTLVMITPLSAATLTLQEGLQKVTTKGRDVQISQAQQAVLASDVALARSRSARMYTPLECFTRRV